MFKRSLFLLMFASLLIFSLSACHVLPKAATEYYILTLPQESEAVLNQNFSSLDENNEIKERRVIALLPVNIPNYLERTHLVFNSDEVKLIFAANHRWAEPVKDGITRVLCDSLTAELREKNIATVPLRMGLKRDYNLQVEISKLKGNINSEVTIRAEWSIYKKKKRVIYGEFYDSLETNSSYEDFVKKNAQLINNLGKDIARNISAIVNEKK